MQLTPNLVFKGNAESALHHYHQALGGELEIRRFSETPAANSVSAEWADKVAHGSLRSPAGTVSAMDAPCERGGAAGDNFVLSLETHEQSQTDEVFAKLLDGGTVDMPLEKTFWSPRFGMLTDKFGIKWMVNQSGGDDYC